MNDTPNTEWRRTRSTPRIDAFADAAERILDALAPLVALAGDGDSAPEDPPCALFEGLRSGPCVVCGHTYDEHLPPRGGAGREGKP